MARPVAPVMWAARNTAACRCTASGTPQPVVIKGGRSKTRRGARHVRGNGVARSARGRRASVPDDGEPRVRRRSGAGAAQHREDAGGRVDHAGDRWPAGRAMEAFGVAARARGCVRSRVAEAGRSGAHRSRREMDDVWALSESPRALALRPPERGECWLPMMPDRTLTRSSRFITADEAHKGALMPEDERAIREL